MWGTLHTTGISVLPVYIHTTPVLSLVFLHVLHCKYVGGDGGNRQLQGMSSPLEYNNPNIVYSTGSYQCLDCYNQWSVHSNLVPYFVTDVIPISLSFICYTYYQEAICILDKACRHCITCVHVCLLIMVREHTYHSPLHCVNSGG